MTITEILLAIIAIFLFMIMKFQFDEWYRNLDKESPGSSYSLVFISRLIFSAIIVCGLVWLLGKGFGSI